jgi:hypothetical protein
MKRVIPRVRSLTIASDGVGAPWSLALLLRTFRALHNLEHLTIATTEPISQAPQYWGAIDAICGSGRIYNSLEMVEFCFGSPHPASGAEYVSRGELGERLPYLAEHGMLKVSDPNVYVPNISLFLPALIDLKNNSQWDGLVATLIYRTILLFFSCLFTCGVRVIKDIKHESAPCETLRRHE